jgi:hypothetical protein
MSDDEGIVMVISVVAGIAGAILTRVSSLPRHFSERNPGIGMMRLAVLAGVAWAAYVIQFHGDASIEDIYVVFYLIMAYAVAKIFGQILGAAFFGLNIRVDVYERKNLAAALFLSAFTLATGIVFGSSIWGEADPLSEAEGGWWIPFGFFMLGWALLVLVTALYLWREPGRFRQQICQERDSRMAGSAAVFLLISAYIIHEGVAGDFWGWRHGILGMGTIGLMLVGHELLLMGTGRRGNMAAPSVLFRLLERGLYVGLGLLVWVLNRMIDRAYMGG